MNSLYAIIVVLASITAIGATGEISQQASAILIIGKKNLEY
jgi:hypothetical protein